MPPSIAIAALVLGGPEVVRVVLNSTRTKKPPSIAIVHVHLPSRQDAQPPVPWRHTVEGADLIPNHESELNVR